MAPRERRWRRGGPDDDRGARPPRALVVALVLACATLMTVDHQGGGSALEPARRALGELMGPAQAGAAAVVRPVAAVPAWFRSRDDLERRIDELEAENAGLRTETRTRGYDRNRLAELDGLTRTAEDLGYALVPARVVAVGPSQSFSSTVTIDAGSRAGLRPDMTVLNNDGLVGRVLRTTSTTSTVLLVVDQDSTVGGRVGESMELGFVHGRGGVGDDARLDLELVDDAAVPDRGSTVLTWGSEQAAPYVSGIPVGEVRAVYTSLRESSTRAVLDPFVDFGALDLVGVVVPSGSSSDRSVIEADGTLQ